MDRNNTVFGHFHAVANFHAAQPVTGRNYQFTGATSFPEQSDDCLNISFRDSDDSFPRDKAPARMSAGKDDFIRCG